MRMMIPRSLEEAMALILALGSVAGGLYRFFQP
ncbi:hypothetical protein ACUXI4_000859 [Pantoea piersonii]